jgi:outer membrane protein assembly factor BamB
MIRCVNFKSLRSRRLRAARVGSLSLLLVVICSCVLLTGCFGTSAAPKGWSGPVAYNGSLYLGTMTGKVVAFEDIGADGNHYIRWSYPDENSYPYFYSDPVIDGGSVYIGCYTGKVYVINASRGYPEWKYPLDGYLGAIIGSPAVADGTLYFGSSDKKLYAVNTTTRTQLSWSPFETDGKIWSTPVVYNGTVYVGSFDGKLYAIDANSGAKLWEFATEGAIVGTPIIYNDVLYFGSLDQKFYAVDAATGQLKSGFTPFKADNWFWAEAVAYNGSIIAASLDGTIYALDAESGAKLWEAETGGTIRGTPALVNNRVVVGTDEGSSKGRVYCYDADTGERLWMYPSADVDPMYAVHASIGSDGNVVYVHTTNQKIYAFDVEQMGAEARYLWTMSTGGGE